MVGVLLGAVHGVAGVDRADSVLERPLFKRSVKPRTADGALTILSAEMIRFEIFKW